MVRPARGGAVMCAHAPTGHEMRGVSVGAGGAGESSGGAHEMARRVGDAEGLAARQAREGGSVIAALYVAKNGAYFGLEQVDPWDEARDARLYDGPWPVVAHPPCSRWCRLAGLVEARWGHKKGDDGGCFESALRAVRTWGGVLEHPAYTDAFAAYGLPFPRPGSWQRTLCGGWVTHVEQGRYGHRAKKATWLYAHGVTILPSLDWQQTVGAALVSHCRNNTRADDTRPRVSKSAASKTPERFRALLLEIAGSARRVLASPARASGRPSGRV